MAKKPRPQDDFRAAETADLFANAVRLHQAGRLNEAEQHYRQVLGRDPRHADSLHLLGVLAHQVGRHDAAVELIGKALALNERVPEFHYNIGLAYGALGRFDEAAIHNRRAIALRPGHAETHLNLGNALRAQGRRAEALASYQRALALRSTPEANYNVANTLAELGRTDEALSYYREALALRPDYAEAHNNLGVALTGRGALREAAASFQRALALKPDLLDAAGLATALLGLGDIESALKATKRLHYAGETPQTRALFFLCLRDPRALPFAAAYRGEIIRALSEPWGNPRALPVLAAGLLKADPVIGPIVTRAQTGAVSANDIAALAGDELLRAALEAVQISDAAIERLLTQVRRAMLHADDAPADAMLALGCALAHQCFINDYVFACPADEAARADALRESIASTLGSGGPIEPHRLAALASYQPLHDVPGAEALLARDWPAPVRALLTRQVREPAEEARIATAMPRLTEIKNEVSQAVRAQYEQNPYPRWTRNVAVTKPRPIDAYLMRHFPLSGFVPLGKPRLDYLIAGCGTGQQATDVVQTFADIDVTAIDLSLASLAYAKRMAGALGLRNITFGQADILELGSLGRRFDVVDSAGVLHHMADPLAGWRVLVSLLPPGGIMRIALYSTLARRNVAAARRLIAERGWPATPDGIRDARQAILALPEGAAERKTADSLDFFSLSECRDLLFHVQEHTFALPAIAAFLSDNGLKFLGFEIAPHVAHRYAERFPGDGAKTDLDNWNLFEHDNPHTFIATYQFWAQKRPGAVSP